MRYRTKVLIVLLASVLGAAGCRQAPDKIVPQQARTPSTDGAPRRGGTVVTGWPSEPAGVNYLLFPNNQPTNEMLFRVFLHLVEEQSDFQEHPPTMAPLLASSYDWSPDHKTLTFHLRDNAVWSDGVPVTADDVRWTWQAQIDPDVAWDNADAKRWITDVEVADPRTVRFHFSRVYAKQLLDANEGMILPKHAWEKLPFKQWRQNSDWFKKTLVFDGPFVIASWTPQQEIVLQRNEHFYDKRFPYLDRVVMRLVPDQASLFTQLLSGDLDFVPQVAVSDVPRAKASPRLQLINYWFNIYVAIGWNNDHPLFKDPEVRRALTLAIDRKTIVDTVLGPYGRVATSPILTSVWAHDRTIQPWPYDPAEARRILESKGWKDTDGDGVLDKGGKPFAFELITNTGNQLRADTMVMVQDQLKKVGIRAEPRPVEFNSMVAQVTSGKYDATLLGYSMDTSLDMSGAFHSHSIGDGANDVHYRNAEVDRLIDLAASQPDVQAEKPYLDQIQQIIHREQPLTFLWESQRLTGVDKRVRNVKPTPAFSMFNVKEWWLAPS
ncbi:MAG: ABC transporter substrate-binding protein [Thermoanaerobaculia bacterium]